MENEITTVNDIVNKAAEKNTEANTGNTGENLANKDIEDTAKVELDADDSKAVEGQKEPEIEDEKKAFREDREAYLCVKHPFYTHKTLLLSEVYKELCFDLKA